MIVNMSANATEEQINHVMDRIKECGFLPHLIQGAERTVIGVVGKNRGRRSGSRSPARGPGRGRVSSHLAALHAGQLSSCSRSAPWWTSSGVKIGGPDLVVIAGPCSVESREQLMETARGVKAAGANLLRGGAYKPRTSPYDFQGLGLEGLKILAEAQQGNRPAHRHRSDGH